MSVKTKKELLVEIEQLKKANRKLEKDVIEFQNKEKAQGGDWEYLYRAEDMTTDYVDSIIARTHKIRERVFYNEDTRTFSQVRQFHDGNQVIIIIEFNRQTKETHQYALFYKKAVRTEVGK